MMLGAPLRGGGEFTRAVHAQDDYDRVVAASVMNVEPRHYAPTAVRPTVRNTCGEEGVGFCPRGYGATEPRQGRRRASFILM